MTSGESITAQGVGEDGVNIKESDPKLQLLHNVQVLVLECALEAARALASAGVVRPGEQELIQSEVTELRSAIAHCPVVMGLVEQSQCAPGSVVLLMIQSLIDGTVPEDVLIPGVNSDPLQQSSIRPMVLQNHLKIILTHNDPFVNQMHISV